MSSAPSLLHVLGQLNSCKDAAEIIFRADAARLLARAPPGDISDPPSSNTDGIDDYSLDIARRIGTMVAKLDELSGSASKVIFTPRMVLYELMDIVREALYTSFPAHMQLEDEQRDKKSVVQHFNFFVSSRDVPIDAAVEGLHVVSYVSVKLRVELVTLRLRSRIEEELSVAQTSNSEEAVAALLVTRMLLDDFTAIFNSIVLLVPITKSAARDSSVENVVHRLAPVYPEYYYRLCDWTLVLESSMSTTGVVYTRVHRLSVDGTKCTAKAHLSRPTASSPWGLLLNERGALVDIDVGLRVFKPAGELHELLRIAPQGARITKVNEVVVGEVKDGDYAAYRRRVVEMIQSLTAKRRLLFLELESSAFIDIARRLPTEVAFLAPPQGGEGTSGQRVTLVLRRQSIDAEWGFTVNEHLYWTPPPLQALSETTKSFVVAHTSQLRLLAVNGVEALHATQAELLIEMAETVVLELLVMPKVARPPRAPSRQLLKSPAAAPAATATGATATPSPAFTPVSAASTAGAPSHGVVDVHSIANAALAHDAPQSLPSVAPASGGSAGLAPLETPLVQAAQVGAAPAAAAALASGAVVTAETNAAALPLSDHVQLMHCTENEMQFVRSTASIPWGLPIGRLVDRSVAPQNLPLRLMDLPNLRTKHGRTHPFGQMFKKDKSTWFIAEVNGVPATDVEATLKQIGQLTRMTLRFLRR
ncbi:hypothetical protein NESM_000258500 [Novymonas esmeraldas]|uniref:Uncharacterized protein n=1 Tax=Novymonas esmeraldas TaxID=1808958 RepID=A0AAW0F5Q5_9TRYP